MSKLSRLEVVTRVVLGLNTTYGSEAFAEPMLARALLKIGEIGEINPDLRNRFLNALADAIEGRDTICVVSVVHPGRRGPPGIGGLLASDRAAKLAWEVRGRCDKARLGPAADTVATVLGEYMERNEVELSQARADLRAGRAAITHLRGHGARRRSPPNS